jgi:hypothetical protein
MREKAALLGKETPRDSIPQADFKNMKFLRVKETITFITAPQ